MRNVALFALPFPVLSHAPVFSPHRKVHFMQGYDFVAGGGGVGEGWGVFFSTHTHTRTHDARFALTTHDPRQLDILYRGPWADIGKSCPR